MSELKPGPAPTRRVIGMILTAALVTCTISAGLAKPATPASVPSENSVKALALQWFAQMEAGQIDRTQLTARYSAQLTAQAVRAMSRQLKLYGASPIGDQVLRTRTIDGQTFYLVKLIFPRGDAVAMLIGFSAGGKISGIDLMSMPGD